MKNPNIIAIIKERFEEQKINAEQQLQLNKIVDMEDKFVKDFSKEKWQEYFDLDIEKSRLENLTTDQLLDFTIEFIRDIKF